MKNKNKLHIFKYLAALVFVLYPLLSKATDMNTESTPIVEELQRVGMNTMSEKGSHISNQPVYTHKQINEVVVRQIEDAKEGDYQSQVNLGYFFEDMMNNHPDWRDYDKAEHYFTLAAAQGRYAPNHTLGYFFLQRSDNPDFLNLAQKYFQIAADQWIDNWAAPGRYEAVVPQRCEAYDKLGYVFTLLACQAQKDPAKKGERDRYRAGCIKYNAFSMGKEGAEKHYQNSITDYEGVLQKFERQRKQTAKIVREGGFKTDQQALQAPQQTTSSNTSFSQSFEQMKITEKDENEKG